MSERFNRTVFLRSIVFALSLIIAVSLFGFARVNADNDPNPSEIDLYFLEEENVSAIGSIPSGYKTSYQINVSGLSGTPTYKIISNSSSVTLSSDGVIAPKAVKWYWKNGIGSTAYMEGATVRYQYSAGTSVVRVTCGSYSKDITVNVINYAQTYADNKIDTVLASIITSGMSDKDKLQAITKWVAENTDYSSKYQSYISMIVFGCGDCWASTNTIIEMCRKVNIKAKIRPANHDLGAGSGHRNAVALCDGEYYIADAGYSGTKPRRYRVTALPGGFTVSGNKICQYDGFEENVIIPETVNGKTITQIGTGSYSIYSSSTGVKSFTIPKTVETVAIGAFAVYPGASVTVASDNPYLTVSGGALYTKDKTQLLYVPSTVTSLTIDKNTTEIIRVAFFKSQIGKLVIPGNVKKINYSAFQHSEIKQIEIESGLTTIEDYAFQYCDKLTSISLPSTLTTVGTNIFYGCSVLENIYFDGTLEEWDQLFSGYTLPSSAKVHCKAVRVTGIDQNGDADITLTKKDQSVELSAKVIPSNATNQDITYTSDNTSVAKLDGNKLIAVGEGTCKVTATTSDGAFTATYNVTVSYPRYKLKIEGGYYRKSTNNSEYTDLTEVEFIEGDSVYARSNTAAEGYKFNKWILDDDVVLNSGSVTSANINIKLPARDLTIKAEFIPITVTNIYIGYANSVTWSYFCPGSTLQLTTTVYPNNALNKNVVWSSSNTSVATVDSNGLITAVAKGSAQIIATAADGSGKSSKISISVADHRWGNKTLTKPYSCEDEGEYTYNCLNDGCNATKTEVAEPVGHTLSYVKAVAPTKQSDGHIAYYKCNRTGCGKIFEDAKGTKPITLEQTIIPALTHYLTKVSAKSATCTQAGNEAYYICKDADCGCGKIYTDQYGQHETTTDKITIPATGHSISKVNAKAATCTEDGHDEYYECGTCHVKFSDAEGKNEITKENVIPKLGHAWDEGKVTQAPGCETKGVKSFSCTRDGCTGSKEEAMEPLGHDVDHLEYHKRKDATDDEDGHEEYYSCPREGCGQKFADAEGKVKVTDEDIRIVRTGAAVFGEKAPCGDFEYQVTNSATDGTGTVTLIRVINETEEVSIPAIVAIRKYTYKVNRIGVKAFSGNTTVKTVSIGSNVAIIDADAFSGCSNLVRVSGGGGLKTIGQNAFARCSKLSTFKITSKVLSKIGYYAFNKDSKLKTIYIQKTTKLTKKGVKKSLKGSKVKKVKVKKSKVRKYRKYFTKKNCGRKVKVKK